MMMHRTVSHGGAPSTAAAAAGGGGGGAFDVGSLAGRWKAKGEKHRKGEHFLRMNPRTAAGARAGKELSKAERDQGPVGIPVREILQQIYHHKRDKTVKDCWMYFIYTMVFVIVVYQINNTKDAYATNAAVFNLFLDQEFTATTTMSPASSSSSSSSSVNSSSNNDNNNPYTASNAFDAAQWAAAYENAVAAAAARGENLTGSDWAAQAVGAGLVNSPWFANAATQSYTGSVSNQYKKTFFDIGQWEEVRVRACVRSRMPA